MDDELTPHQAERVRRLLAEARHTEPMPDDVAARLDRVIAGLADDPESRPAADGSPAPDGAPSYASTSGGAGAGGCCWPPRPWWSAGSPSVSSWATPAGEDEASSPAAETADEQGLPAPDRDTRRPAARLRRAPTRSCRARCPAPAARSPGSHLSCSGRPGSPGTPARWPPGRGRAASGTAQLAQSDDADELSAPRPALPAPGAAAATSASSSTGRPGWLVYRAPRGDTQVVDLFLCGSDSPERSATLPLD